MEYFIALCEIPLFELASFRKEHFSILRDIVKDFSQQDAEKIKALEKVTNHDVKAVEYFLKEKYPYLLLVFYVCLFLFSSSFFFFFLIRVIFDANGWEQYKEFLHFALTSQDINNTAIPLAFKEFVEGSLMTSLSSLVDVLKGRAHEWKDVAMLARTHGQPATPTVVGKEVPNTFLHPPSSPPIVFFLFFPFFFFEGDRYGCL